MVSLCLQQFYYKIKKMIIWLSLNGFDLIIWEACIQKSPKNNIFCMFLMVSYFGEVSFEFTVKLVTVIENTGLQ